MFSVRAVQVENKKKEKKEKKENKEHDLEIPDPFWNQIS